MVGGLFLYGCDHHSSGGGTVWQCAHGGSAVPAALMPLHKQVRRVVLGVQGSIRAVWGRGAQRGEREYFSGSQVVVDTTPYRMVEHETNRQLHTAWRLLHVVPLQSCHRPRRRHPLRLVSLRFNWSD